MDILILKGVEFSYVVTMSHHDLLNGELILSFHAVKERIFRIYMHKLCYSYNGNSHG